MIGSVQSEGRKKRELMLKDGSILQFDQMKIMGILNVTPDSFYEESRNSIQETAVLAGMRMIEEGADILDIGGESTRPFAEPVTEEEELARVIPVIRDIRSRNSSILISVDTYRAATARAAVLAGADMINDISALRFDPSMAGVVAKLQVPVVLMHMLGTPKNMQENPEYSNVLQNVADFFSERVAFAVKSGIHSSRIILDPGIGFGKRYEHNIELIRNISSFEQFQKPILLAASRKSVVGTALGNAAPKDRLEGTLALSCYASMQNVDMIRVHDVLENKRAVRMMEVLK